MCETDLPFVIHVPTGAYHDRSRLGRFISPTVSLYWFEKFCLDIAILPVPGNSATFILCSVSSFHIACDSDVLFLI